MLQGNRGVYIQISVLGEGLNLLRHPKILGVELRTAGSVLVVKGIFCLFKNPGFKHPNGFRKSRVPAVFQQGLIAHVQVEREAGNRVALALGVLLLEVFQPSRKHSIGVTPKRVATGAGVRKGHPNTVQRLR